MIYLHELLPGQTARIVGYSEDSPVIRRLAELGLSPGRSITYLRRAPLRDPLEIKVGGSSLALRKAEASLVAVELED